MRREFTTCDNCGGEISEIYYKINNVTQLLPSGLIKTIDNEYDVCSACLNLSKLFSMLPATRPPENRDFGFKNLYAINCLKNG